MVDKLNILSGLYVDLEYVPAPIVKRVIALAIDRLIQYILVIFIFIFIECIKCDVSDDNYVFFFVVYTMVWLLPFFCEYFMNGQTIGKKMMRIMVVTDECTPPSFMQCAIRSLLYTIDFWLIGAILISRKAKRLGDMASGCMVVLKKSSKEERVSLAEDYRYTNPDYQPHYPEAREMAEEDFDLLKKALYDILYYTQADVVAQRLKKHLQLTTELKSTRFFLLQLYNDYLYYRDVCEEKARDY